MTPEFSEVKRWVTSVVHAVHLSANLKQSFQAENMALTGSLMYGCDTIIIASVTHIDIGHNYISRVVRYSMKAKWSHTQFVILNIK